MTKHTSTSPSILGIPVSPLNRRRFDRFKKNKRGYYALWIFSILFFLSLFAEFIANDKPILVSYHGTLYTPIFKEYPETAFGGEFETEADYRDPCVQEFITGQWVPLPEGETNDPADHCIDENASEPTGWILWPPVPYSYQTINYNLPSPAPSAPTKENILGTDDQGRDVFARLIYGFRISILFGFALTIASSIIGIIVGAFQGYFGGKIDLLGQRFIEIWSGMPSLFILIILASMFIPGFWMLLFIMLLFSWTSLVGLIRAEFLRGRNFDYVKAAKALGASDISVMFKHVLPNAMVATLTFLPFILNGSITTLTSLDFLGFGMPPGSPSLGELLQQGKANLQAPWLGISAFCVLSLMLSLLIFIGEAVRDAFDPRKTFD